ncbi:lipopolysaccharide biosynthesis protein [Brevibacterium luteolum]|nr:lipopolysaccharide biosynthesis protein [Brevibacterium luteolum]
MLSRIFAPSDFGLIAMVTVAVTLGELLRDAGLTTSALKATRLSNQQSTNLFWINFGLGVASGLLIVLAAPFLAIWYGEPRVIDLAPLLALTLVFTGCQAQITVKLSRDQRYVALALSDVAGQLIGLLCTVGLAIAGWGYWALAMQYVIAAASTTALRWTSARWFPSRPRRGHGTRYFVRSGIDYSISQMIAYTASNVDTFIIGARWGSASLGFYNRAYQILQVPLARALTPLNNVALPMLASAHAMSGDHVSRQLLRLQSLIVGGTVAVFAITGGAADQLIPLVLGDQWGKSVPIFQILAVAGALHSLGHINYWAMLILVSSRSYLWSVVVTRAITIVLVAVGAYFAPAGAAVGYALSLLLTWIIQLLWLKAGIGISISSFGWSGIRFMTVGAVAFTATIFIGRLFPIESQIAILGLQCILGMIVFGVVLCLFPSGREDISVAVDTARSVFR